MAQPFRQSRAVCLGPALNGTGTIRTREYHSQTSGMLTWSARVQMKNRSLRYGATEVPRYCLGREKMHQDGDAVLRQSTVCSHNQMQAAHESNFQKYKAYQIHGPDRTIARCNDASDLNHV